LQVLVFLFSGCTLDSESPLSDPDNAKVDEKVLGKWINTDKDAFAQTTTVEKISAKGYPPGVMKLALRPVEAGDNPAGMFGLVFCTELKGKTYVNLCGQMVDAPAKLPAWEKVRAGQFSILKYAVEGDTLSLWHLRDEAPLETAIANGKLKGTVRKRGQFDWGPKYRVTDTTANLAQIVADADEKLFSGAKAVLVRAK
jgi:hypothetical protein